MSWTASDSNHDNFEILRDGVVIATLSADTLTYEDSTLDPDTSYSYTIWATNYSGTSPISNSVTATTESPTSIRFYPTDENSS